MDAHVLRTRGNVLRVEWMTDPLGAVKLKSAQLVSPEGVVYAPKESYDVSEQAARNLGRLLPYAVPKQKKSKSAKAKIGSLLLGTALTTLSGVSGSSGSAASSAANCGTAAVKQGASSGFSTLGAVSALAPLALTSTGGSGKNSSKEVEWVEPKTAGTGIFSSVAEFECLSTAPAQNPWRLEAQMEQHDGSVSTYTYLLDPALFVLGAGGQPPGPSGDLSWRGIQLIGPRSKLL